MSTIITDVELAKTHLQRGEIVAIPTETVYGLAGNAENDEAIHKIYALKQRPLNHPLIMHVAQDWDLSKWVSFVPEYARILIDKFWPGPLTLVLKSNLATVSPLITGGQDTIALRSPKHPIAQKLLQELNFPLVAPSANPFGKISPTTAEHVRDSFKENELLILDGGRCQVGIESTILAAIAPDQYKILRHGVITEQQISAILPQKAAREESSIRVPGKLASHYQPEKPLYCFENAAAIQQFCERIQEAVFVISFAEFNQHPSHLYYKMPVSAEQYAFELYYQLRHADQSQASCIAIELPPAGVNWEGVRERILKAAYR
ncbi:L-threonylcarbamoyladenylate synthase [Legionella hackeliae]|uniref:Threonylcarbamoyl-AMP synthase n=1 Tax=Legionella hackeliae TaxID=449 RepID=A0A0A8UQA0_LEGHA|nr:L-threonylcarbamoyladenylate synthase [Legionella hackeliae]KTD10172.1 SUA5/yciO/yrdC family transporter:Sua5/YciO/YrdC/YwlC family transporter protein [Legionella hackeliae]CEK09666.1 Sua5/YciO/YrdC/YwlC family protein [Legionella hackeliae]STX49578.1 putative translation factor [Legionella hackeliae]